MNSGQTLGKIVGRTRTIVVGMARVPGRRGLNRRGLNRRVNTTHLIKTHPIKTHPIKTHPIKSFMKNDLVRFSSILKKNQKKNTIKETRKENDTLTRQCLLV
jgi:hypothetical protein